MRILTASIALISVFLIGSVAYALMIAPVNNTANIRIDDAYSYVTPKTNPAGAIFFTVKNGGNDDRLIDFTIDGAARTELHTMDMNNDIMQMRKVDGYDVGEGEVLILDPMGNHIMVFDRNDDWNEGDVIHAQATFENAGVIPVSIDIINRGAKSPMNADDAHMHHGHD